MPIGAENIGTAYVRVIADGKDFDLNQMFDESFDADRAARRTTKSYEKAMAKEAKGPSWLKLQKTLTDNLVSMDAGKRFISSPQWKNYREALIRDHKDIGRLAGENLEQEILRGIPTGQIEKRLSDIRRDLARANDQLVTAANKIRREELDEAYRLNKEFNDRVLRLQRQGAIQAAAIREDEMRTLRAQIDLQRQGAIQAAAIRMNDAIDAKQRLLDADKLSAKHRAYHTKILQIADATGAAFGRGSRNNFLNFTGSVARNVVALGASLFDLGGYARNVRNNFTAAGGGIAGFAAALRSVRGVALGAVGGLAGLFGIIGPLTSILSGLGGMMLALASSMGGALLGAVSALSSSIVFGLAGALGIGATSFIPLIAGLGVFALAVANADKDTKAAFKSIGREFDGLGRVAASSAFSNIDEQASRFKNVIGDLSPLVRDIGTSISEVGDAWLTMMEGPGFAKFQSAMTRFLPGAVKDLGIALGDFAGGMGGLFRALIPQTSSFLDYIRNIARDFNNFTNSVRGQSVLRNFFADAASSAADLGGFLSAVRTLLAEVFEQANAPGDGLFRSMTRALTNWTQALDANPDIMGGWMRSMESFGRFVGSTRDLLLELLSAGDLVGNSLFESLSTTIDGWVSRLRANPDILNNWYTAAGSFARALGDVVVGLGKVFAALDNTFSRSLLTGTFEVIAAVIEGFATTLEGITSIFGGASEAVQSFAGQVTAAAFVFPLLNKAMGLSALTGFITNLRTAETRMAALGGAARLAAGVGGLAAFTAGASSSNDAAGFLLQTLGGAGAGFALGGPWGALIGGTAGAAMALFSNKTDSAGGAAESARPKFMDLAGSLDQITGASNRATRELILQEAATTGALGQAKAFGISARDLVSASLGSEDALRRVNAALEGGATKTITYKDEFGGIISMQVDTKKQMDQVTSSLHAQGLEILTVENAAIDLAASNGVRKFVADSNAAWSTSTQKVKENYLATQDLSGLIGKIPKKAYTDIEARGVAPTIAGVAKVAAKYDLMPKQVRSLLQVMGVDLSVRDIRRLQADLDATERKKNTPKIDIDKSAADRGIRGVTADLNALDRKPTKPKIDVDPATANSKIRGVDVDLGNLHRKVTNPRVTVEASAANTTLAGLKSSLAAIVSKNITITAHHVSTGKIPRTAAGGTFYGAQTRLIGEAGPEAVVPLARNLSQVDPSVRWLSAIAQGKSSPMARGGIGGLPSKTVNADGWTIVSNSKDPEVVANEVLNRLVGAGY